MGIKQHIASLKADPFITRAVATVIDGTTYIRCRVAGDGSRVASYVAWYDENGNFLGRGRKPPR